jgi:hypothetical protein
MKWKTESLSTELQECLLNSLLSGIAERFFKVLNPGVPCSGVQVQYIFFFFREYNGSI